MVRVTKRPGVRRRKVMKKSPPKTAMVVAKKALRIAKNNVEESKYYDTYITAFANYNPTTAATGGLVSLSNVPKDTTGIENSYTRNDEEIKITSLQLRGILVQDSANYPTNNIRIIIIIDYDNAFASVNDLLQFLPAAAPTADATCIYAPYKYENFVLAKKCKVLYDKCFPNALSTGNAVPAAVSYRTMPIKIHKTINIKSSWFPYPSTVTKKNEIKAFFLADLPFASKGLGLSFSGTSRIYFKEN